MTFIGIKNIEFFLIILEVVVSVHYEYRDKKNVFFFIIIHPLQGLRATQNRGLLRAYKEGTKCVDYEGT